VDRNYLVKTKAAIDAYAPDGGGSYSTGDVNIHYCAFHTTKESRRETQPFITESGAVIAWDGRLDNRAELIRSVPHVLNAGSTDVSIVAATYQEYGTGCFAKLIGDWAVSIWEPKTRSLILAKDFIGTRHLYYSVDKEQVTWSTVLDPLVLFTKNAFALCEEYIAGWFAFFPAAHLTPYVGIHSVPPSSFAFIRAGKHSARNYWDFDPGKRIHHRTDGEYEEHFRSVFAESVRRRLRSDSPILAELSGGMDSSSIVCVADTVIARGAAGTPRLDTVSYYDDTEPNWNERPYFTKVEEKRGRTGTHIDVGSSEAFHADLESGGFLPTPDSAGRMSSKTAKQFASCLTSRGNRVVLSGIGGDEVTGGAPSPTPELADLLARARFKALAHQLKAWSLNKRKPWFHLFFESVREFLPPLIFGVPEPMRPVPWLHPAFVSRNRSALVGYQSRLKFFGHLPSFQQNASVLNALRRQLECSALPTDHHYEKCYPYLDRDFLEFIYAIPREQLVRPGQRRSLMRRALVGTVPDEILSRKRKAFVARAPMVCVSTGWPRIVEMSQHMVCASLEIITQEALFEALQKARRGQQVPIVPLIRTFSVESWLQHVRRRVVHTLEKGKSNVPSIWIHD
jgi:asparagine synthase (glutamine-hydrolysing)